MATVSPACHREVHVLSSKNVNSIGRVERPRDLSPSRVTAIAASLKAGVHFDRPLMVNVRKDGKKITYRTIDGSHRLEAVRRVIAENPNFTVAVPFDVYDNLTDEQEFQVFDMAANAGPESLGQMIERHGYPLWQRLQEFPAPVRWQRSGAGGSSKRQGMFDGVALMRAISTVGYQVPKSAARPELIRMAVRGDAYPRILEFGDAVTLSFGRPQSNNPWFRAAALTALARIYFANREVGASKEELIRAWGERLKSNASLMAQLLRVGFGGSASILYIEDLTVAAMCHSGAQFKLPKTVWKPRRGERISKR